MRHFLLFGLFLLMAAPVAAQQTGAQTFVRDITLGDGDTAINGARVVVQYVGWLEDGTKFDSTYDRGEPFSFTLGGGEVIPGWDVGIKGMRVGGRRELIVPPSMAYGEKGAGNVVPSNATLRFDIELIHVEATAFSLMDPAALKGALSSVTLVDIRAGDTSATIDGAITITAFDASGKLNRHFLSALLKRVKKADTVVLIDDDGKQSAFIGSFLAQSAGFEDLRGLKGGLKAWRKAGFPLTR